MEFYISASRSKVLLGGVKIWSCSIERWSETDKFNEIEMRGESWKVLRMKLEKYGKWTIGDI